MASGTWNNRVPKYMQEVVRAENRSYVPRISPHVDVTVKRNLTVESWCGGECTSEPLESNGQLCLVL